MNGDIRYTNSRKNGLKHVENHKSMAMFTGGYLDKL